MNIFVVIPAFNEIERIEKTLIDLSKSGSYQIVVVDDGSTDGTAAIAEKYAVVLRHPINRGMGAALATGTAYAVQQGADIVVHFDADGQHSAADIPRIVAPIIDKKAEVVFGSRYLGNSHVPFSKKYLIHMPARVLQNALTGIRLTDVHNGFRAMSRDAAGKIRIQQDRMAHASEIVAEVHRLGLPFTEVPVTISYREYGQGFAAGIRILKDLIVRKLLP